MCVSDGVLHLGFNPWVTDIVVCMSGGVLHLGFNPWVTDVVMCVSGAVVCWSVRFNPWMMEGRVGRSI